MNDQLKYKIISLLKADHSAKDIASDLDVSYGSVLKLRRDFEEARMNGTIDTLVNMDKLLIETAAGQLEELPNASKAAVDLTKGLEGLEQLSIDLQQSASLVNTRVRSLLMSIDHASELEILTDILCKLQTSFVNKNMTQVNVQNNFGNEGTPKYNQFLGDKPGD